jgi:hypothetical protein
VFKNNLTRAFRQRLVLTTRVAAIAIILIASIPVETNGSDERRTPDLSKVFAAARSQRGKRPIILVPGILNMNLINSKTRETVWPSAWRSGTDDVALPITGDPLNASDNLVATKAIDSVRFLPLTRRVNFLGTLLETLRRDAGYQEGSWDNPLPDGDRDTFYTFVYDWRRDNVRIAQQLIAQIVALKSKLKRPNLQFDVVTVSMGGLIARYAAMYGDQDLPRDQTPPKITWAGAAHIKKIFMFAPPNEGSMEAFATVLDGYSINDGPAKHRHLLRKLSREDAFTGLAVFQLMPHKQIARFLDRDLKPLEVDLYDPATWKLYGWSIAHDAEFRESFARKTTNGATTQNHSAANLLDIHLQATLERTKAFHRALDAASDGTAPVPLYTFGGDCQETLNAAIVYYDKEKNRWVTLTTPRELRASDGHKISKDEVRRAMYIPGDGRVTRASVMGEDLPGPLRSQSTYGTALPISHAFFACGGHGDLHNNLIFANNALTLILAGAINKVGG